MLKQKGCGNFIASLVLITIVSIVPLNLRLLIYYYFILFFVMIMLLTACRIMKILLLFEF